MGRLKDYLLPVDHRIPRGIQTFDGFQIISVTGGFPLQQATFGPYNVPELNRPSKKLVNDQRFLRALTSWLSYKC